MEDATRFLGQIGAVVSKIVRRDKKPRELATSLQTALNNDGTTPSTPALASPASSVLSPIAMLLSSTNTTTAATVPTTTSPVQTAAVSPSGTISNNLHITTTTTSSTPGTPAATTPANHILVHTNSTSDIGHPYSSVTNDLESVVIILYGDSTEGASQHKPADPVKAKEMVDCLIEFDLIRRLLESLRIIEFEARKCVTRICEYALSQRRDVTIPYIEQRPAILTLLVSCYDASDVSIALCGDAILRACIATEPLTYAILNTTPPNILIQPFFKYLEMPNFDIQSHAFATFKYLLTVHQDSVSNYLRENYEFFFNINYNNLLLSEHFLCKVQSFQFLSELLMTRDNHDVMMKYVNDAEHLKIAMKALRGPKAIQLAAFNVLKIFVPNPYKADSIINILSANKKIFLAFLAEFEKDSTDETMIAHKKEMIEALEALP